MIAYRHLKNLASSAFVMPGVDSSPPSQAFSVASVDVVCDLCSPHQKQTSPPLVLTTLSPSLSNQPLSHTAVSLVHLSLPTTVLFYLYASHVALSSSLIALSHLSVSHPLPTSYWLYIALTFSSLLLFSLDPLFACSFSLSFSPLVYL